MGILGLLTGKLESNVQRMAQDNAWHYTRETCGLDVRSLPASLVQDAHTRMVAIYEEMSRNPGVKPFNIPEEAALRLAFVAARAAKTKTADPGELVVACARILAISRHEIRPMCMIMITKALDGVVSEDSVAGQSIDSVNDMRTKTATSTSIKQAKSRQTGYTTVAQSQKSLKDLLRGG